MAIAEPLICGLTHPQDLDPPKSMPTLFLVQLGILSLSTLLHIFGNAMEFIFVFNLFNAWNSISPHQLEECRYKYTQIINDIKERTTWGKLSLVYDACETLEVVCLIWGWSWIFIQPGVAVLRCFRIFRIIYYFDIDRESALHVSSKNLINYIDKSVVYWFPIWSLHTNRLEDTFSTFDSAKDADQEWFYDMVTFSQRSKFRVVSDGELNSELIIIRQMVAYSFDMKYDLTTNHYINIAEATSASDSVRDEIDATVQQYYNKLLTYEKVKFSLYLEKFASREQVVKWEVLKRKKKNKEISEAQYNSDLSLLIEHLNVEAKAKFNLHKTGDVETINLFNMYTRQLLIGNAIEKEKAKAHIEADNFINSKAVYKLLGRKQRKKFKHLKGSIKRSLEKEIIISLNSKTKVDYTAAYTAQEQLEAFSEEVTARIGHKDEMENIIVQSAQAYDRKMRDLYFSKPSDQFITLHHICHIAMTYFRQLYLEFFTRQSRGGLVIIFLFFYLTYVLAVLFHYEAYGMQDGHGAPCGSLGLCYVRLMRLLFYDGMYINLCIYVYIVVPRY